MSHLPQRKEKDCLNCRTQVNGRFCHNCGQENIEPKESVWHLVTHFFNDLTHFDGKFFTSLKVLILKPGFLSKEYIAGRRASYLNPIRMYVFTSAIFFLVFFSINNINEKKLKENFRYSGKTSDEISKMDSATLSDFSKKINKGTPLTKAQVLARIDSGGFQITPGDYRSKGEYDSLLKTGAKKHNWIERQMIYKSLDLKVKYGSDAKLILVALITRFLHSLPQMLFALLPLLALILKLVYIRQKQFYYVDHVIFTIHFYIFTFLVMLITFGISELRSLLHWEWLRYIGAIFILSIFFYFYKALRNFYLQRRGKTIVKYFILLFSFSITIVLMFIIFLFLSMFSI